MNGPGLLTPHDQSPEAAIAALRAFNGPLLLALRQGASALVNWTAAALLGWTLFRARADLRAAAMSARRLDGPRP